MVKISIYKISIYNKKEHIKDMLSDFVMREKKKSGVKKISNFLKNISLLLDGHHKMLYIVDIKNIDI